MKLDNKLVEEAEVAMGKESRYSDDHGHKIGHDKSSSRDGNGGSDKKKTIHDMSMSDIKDVFKEDFADEIHDANKYLDMMAVAEMHNNKELVRGLHMIAYDEYTHAKFIHECLVDWGCEIDHEDKMAWHELKERAERKFRF